MSKTQGKPEKVNHWSRYPEQLAGIRISTELSTAIEARAKSRKLRVSDYVRAVLETDCGLVGAQSGAHFDAETA